MRNRDLARMKADLAARQLRDPEAAAARARRGRALVDAALRGEGVPEPAQELRPPPARAAPRLEVTACAKCYRPHEAPPGSVCTSCADPAPQDLSWAAGSNPAGAAP